VLEYPVGKEQFGPAGWAQPPLQHSVRQRALSSAAGPQGPRQAHDQGCLAQQRARHKMQAKNKYLLFLMKIYTKFVQIQAYSHRLRQYEKGLNVT
jgi:hypothetical protein